MLSLKIVYRLLSFDKRERFTEYLIEVLIKIMVHKFQIEEAVLPSSRARSITSQLIACTSPYLLLLDLGMAVSFATIALPDLLNADKGLSLDQTQASWFGSIAYIAQPLGAVLSGPIVDYFGRKKATCIVNIPHLIAWILLYYAWNVPVLFVANSLIGLGTGLMEAPINSYVGEVSETSLRGALCTLAQLFANVGLLVMYGVGAVLPWRRAALLALTAPIASMLLVLLIPETPIWLLSRGREKEALNSLCYLRGWCQPDAVRDEFNHLTVYTKSLQTCAICSKLSENGKTEDCVHKNMNSIKRFALRMKYVMLCKETLRPLSLVLMYFMFVVMSGLIPLRPNMVYVCGALGMAASGKWVTFMVGVLTFCTSVLVVVAIKIVGKRKLAITSLLGAAFSCTALSFYAKRNLEDSVFSYEPSTFPEQKNMTPLVLFFALTIFNGLSVPWVLLGEVFPFRSRATSQGIAAAGYYVVTFFATKTFINLESSVHLWGSFALYAAFGFIGTLYLYLFLPETEGKTLQDIELFYSGEFRTFADDPFINFFKRSSK